MFPLVHLLALLLAVSSLVVDLNGPWTFCSSKGDCYTGHVPGDVFTDLYRAEIIPHPLYADNSLNLTWISREKWTYRRQFTVAKEQIKLGEALILHIKNLLVVDQKVACLMELKTFPVLIFEGIDTVSKVYLNGQLLLNSDNQFRRYILDISDFLKEDNLLEVQFESPVQYAQTKSEKYKANKGHDLPPVCPPDIYHGECHPNFVRKAQYSFSWDWGPSIPTVGLWRPVKLLLTTRPTPLSLSWITEKLGNKCRILGSLEYWNIPGEVECSVDVEGLGNRTFQLQGRGPKMGTKRHDFTVELEDNQVELWWPATHGKPKLYNLTVTCEGSEETIVEEIGFRTVELVQDLVDEKVPQKGRHFYFKINGKEIFLKGSNWIPASMFPVEDVSKRVDFLLDSAVEANMNVLRVWGGGVYESEYFYRLANRKGLLLWQDMMFACALYPNDKKFLTTVGEEVEQQVYRLRKHPSVLLFAGNNENEVAIRGHWWSVDNYTEQQQLEDYLSLYSSTIAPLVRQLDPSRPFLLSSPSNGLETEEEGGVAKNPGDERYGDVHFYNEFIDLWQDFVYQTPRCASEYGIQSFPARETMLKWLNASDYSYASPTMVHRQHHPGGIATNLMVVYEHFPLAKGCTLHDLLKCRELEAANFMDRFSYYSQAHQAIMYKVQTEHYRRFRGKLLEDGRGNTMCALYWQLNDVWAAPTWSSVDFNLKWKMVHYEAKRFFAPIIVVLYSTASDDLGITVVNDGQRVVGDVHLRLLQFGWGSGFEPVYQKKQRVVLPEEGVLDVNVGGKKLKADYDSDYLFAAELTDGKGNLVAPISVLLPDKLYEAQLDLCGDVSIEKVEQVSALLYTVTIISTDISPLTWLSFHSDIPFWFSDNGFTMISPRREVTLHLREEAPSVSVEQITVCNIKTCGLL